MATILIIDDNRALRELWAEALTENDYKTFTAGSGLEGVDLARKEPIDLVITDVLMPDKDGLETLLEIKSSRPELKVIVASGGGDMGDTSFLEAARKLGADGTLQKPVRLSDLYGAVSRLLDS